MITGVSLVPVVLTGDVLLPGETHRLDASWDEEMAVLARLSGPDERIVLLPRAVHHSDSGLAIGVLAVEDAVGSDGFAQTLRARLFALRRVEVRGLTRRGAALVAEVGEVDEVDEGDASEADLDRLLRLARPVARRESLEGLPGLSPELGGKSPSQLADAVAVELGASDAARLMLLRATKWVDRLPILEPPAKPRRTRLRAPRARRRRRLARARRSHAATTATSLPPPSSRSG